jgi:acetyltransferase-like isoleucine patch superfamily enzyme
MKNIIKELMMAILSIMPNDIYSCRFRVFIYRKLGFNLSGQSRVFRNVLLLGNITLGSNSSISNNCSINGGEVGVFIGQNVMIAPGCCIVAFNHGIKLDKPMCQQDLIEHSIFIGDDVWVGANVTITSGVHIGTGVVVGANSVVTKNLPDYSIAYGIPAKVVKYRNSKEV